MPNSINVEDRQAVTANFLKVVLSNNIVANCAYIEN